MSACEDLRKLVGTTGSSDRTCKAGGKTEIYKRVENKEKEDGTTKVTEDSADMAGSKMRMYLHRSQKYITSGRFYRNDIYRTVAELLYEQHEQGQVNPAQIMNHFTDEEEHREVAALF